jgi:hypothetical protein
MDCWNSGEMSFFRTHVFKALPPRKLSIECYISRRESQAAQELYTPFPLHLTLVSFWIWRQAKYQFRFISIGTSRNGNQTAGSAWRIPNRQMLICPATNGTFVADVLRRPYRGRSFDRRFLVRKGTASVAG